MALITGLQTMTLALGLTLGFLLQRGGVETFSWIYDNWVPLLSASLAMSFIQATWVWAYSFFSGELLALGGNSGNIVYDVRACIHWPVYPATCAGAHTQWFLGRPLNPTLPGFPKFDLKTFNEVRPGIIGWTLLNIACACEQYLRNGRVTDSMILVVLFQAWYSFDSLWEEVRRRSLNSQNTTHCSRRS
jgi:delta14-sterol reductase